MEPNKRRLLVVPTDGALNQSRVAVLRRCTDPCGLMGSPHEPRPVSYQMYTLCPERHPPRTCVGRSSRAMVGRHS